MNNITAAFLMSLFAGLSTGIGSVIALLTKQTNKKFMSLTLGFSAGVMVYVSMTEIMNKAKAALCAPLGEKIGNVILVCSFFGGILLMALISRLIPSYEDGDMGAKYDGNNKGKKNSYFRLMKSGLLCALAIGIHNFPEGMATFVSALKDPQMALPIVCAVAIHNIPEGIAVAAPVYKATGSRKRAFAVSFLSGLAEPLGALIGWLVLLPFMSDILFGAVFAACAGIMVFISIDEIFPQALEEGEKELSILGFVLGMGLMAISLLLFL